jgi:16S rRNA C1402 (ribose-2'-O) methylase RsmI
LTLRKDAGASSISQPGNRLIGLQSKVMQNIIIVGPACPQASVVNPAIRSETISYRGQESQGKKSTSFYLFKIRAVIWEVEWLI